MYVCMYAVVVVAAAAVIIVIVLCYWKVRRRVVACGGSGVAVVASVDIYISISMGEANEKIEKKRKRRKEKKKREELECVGGVISRKITGTVCTYGVWLYVLVASSYRYRGLCVCFVCFVCFV